MPEIKKILFPVDFSESCYAAARYVEAFAGQFEAEVQLLHIVGMGEHALADELLPERRMQIDNFLKEEFKYFTTHRVCVVGDAAARIAEATASWNPDLVAMPTHGLGTFRRVLIGSVTAKILNDLACPVWTGVHLETPRPLEAIHCKRIMCALDYSERGIDVLRYAWWLTQQFDAQLAVVHATPPLNGAYYGYGIEEEYAEAMVGDARKKIDELQEAAGAHIDQVYISAGAPWKIVSCAAQQFDADLVVMGRHSTSGIAGFLRPNAYSILREIPCPAISI